MSGNNPLTINTCYNATNRTHSTDSNFPSVSPILSRLQMSMQGTARIQPWVTPSHCHDISVPDMGNTGPWGEVETQLKKTNQSMVTRKVTLTYFFFPSQNYLHLLQLLYRPLLNTLSQHGAKTNLSAANVAIATSPPITGVTKWTAKETPQKRMCHSACHMWCNDSDSIFFRPWLVGQLV